jgi:hypothetical protein
MVVNIGSMRGGPVAVKSPVPPSYTIISIIIFGHGTYIISRIKVSFKFKGVIPIVIGYIGAVYEAWIEATSKAAVYLHNGAINGLLTVNIYGAPL